MRLSPSIVAITLFSMSAFGLSALEIEGVRPGRLESAVYEPDTVTQLTVSDGVLNASDFGFIADRMTSLQSLDMSGCRIESDRLPDCALLGQTVLRSIALPTTLRVIGTAAFSGSGVESIVIPASVDSIADFAFMRCGNLTSAEFQGTPASIGRDAFANCTELTTVRFADSNCRLTTLSRGVFEGCLSLTEINLEALSGCDSIGPFALAHCISVSEITLPASTASVADGAMAATTGLTRIDARSLNRVPDAGNDVWAGVDCSAATLIASDSTADEFRAAPQWKEFRVISDSQLKLQPLPAGGESTLKVGISGLTLNAAIDSGAIGTVEVFTTAGVKVAQAEGRSNSVSIKLPAKGIYIVKTGHGMAKIKIKI